MDLKSGVRKIWAEPPEPTAHKYPPFISIAQQVTRLVTPMEPVDLTSVDVGPPRLAAVTFAYEFCLNKAEKRSCLVSP